MRVSTSLLFVAAAAASAAAADSPRLLPPPSSIVAALNAASTYFLSLPSSAPADNANDCGWTRGTLYAGVVRSLAATQNASTSALASRWAAIHNYSCFSSINANDFACGMAFAGLYDMAPAPGKIAPLAATLETAVTDYKGYDWFWVDALFMGLDTMLLYGSPSRANDDRFVQLALREYNETTYGGANKTSQPGLWSDEYGLYYRDKTYIGSKSPNGLPVFWARGNGWASAAMALSYEALPQGHPAAPEFASRLASLAASLAAVQNETDGMWRANLLDAAAVPNPETTGTAAFTFAIAHGINMGILPSATFAPVVASAWNGLAKLALQPNGLVGWCQPPNGQPAPTVQNSTSDFCVGLFLMAGAAVHELAMSSL